MPVSSTVAVCTQLHVKMPVPGAVGCQNVSIAKINTAHFPGDAQ